MFQVQEVLFGNMQFHCSAKWATVSVASFLVYDNRSSEYTMMLLQQTVTEPIEAFQKQFNCGQFPIVDAVCWPARLSFSPAATQEYSHSRRGSSFDVLIQRWCWLKREKYVEHVGTHLFPPARSEIMARRNSFIAKFYNLSLTVWPLSWSAYLSLPSSNI